LPWDLDELGMGFVALFFAGLALWFYKHDVDTFYKAVDWDLLGFFASLFVVIYVMEQAEVLAIIGKGLQEMLALPPQAAQASLLISAAAASSVTDNIPLAAVLAKILATNPIVVGPDGSNPDSPFWWCVIYGANLGGNITPIGSASTVVAMTIIHKNKLPLTFVGFVKVAAAFAVVQIFLAIGYVWLTSYLF
jgi:Na+/H+ antiporter NhaD/arsenite permease-like protein